MLVHLMSVLRPAGGLFESVRHLCTGGCASNGTFQVGIIGTRDNHTDRDSEAWRPLAVRTHPIWGPGVFGYAPGMAADLFASNPDLVHVHGMWKYPSIAALRWARRTGKPYIVSPHGMLEPWSLQQARFKKRLAGWLYQWPCLKHAACLRATSCMEAQSIRQAGFKNHIAVIPNGVVVPVANQKAEGRKQKPKIRKVLFLSRIHPKKGLLNLVKAWHIIQPPGWELLIVGPDQRGHLAEVQAAVSACGLENQTHFQSEVMDSAKIQCYRDADLFVLPSFSENFGLVIAEALSCCVPVITTRATPWQDLETHRCGWWIETGVEPLVKALREATALSDAERSEMGRRGRHLIEHHYTWPAIADKMCAVYDWILGGGPAPGCVRFD
jgi:glycosyltransferase involved in cell wall biosynthesis